MTSADACGCMYKYTYVSVLIHATIVLMCLASPESMIGAKDRRDSTGIVAHARRKAGAKRGLHAGQRM